MRKKTPKTLKDIVEADSKLRKFNLIKPNKYDKSTWKFEIVDERSPFGGSTGLLSNHYCQITTMRYDNHFFIVYKLHVLDGEEPEYLVDTKRANHKNSVESFVNSMAEYCVYSNDVSYFKNAPSFKVSQREMKYMGIDNYLDLCNRYGQFSAIGTGLTRDIRNLVVLDIDVNCDTPNNKAEVDRILLEFAKCGALPDFIIKNHETHHIQMQWLVKDVQYKIMNQTVIKNLIKSLNEDENRRKEINIFGNNYMELTNWGVDYRKFSTALTCISNKHKFGDKNYRYWKAKNFESARLGLYNLELSMPYYRDGEVKYLSKEEIDSLLSTKEARQEYYNEAPTIVELYQKTKNLIGKYVEKIDDKKIKKIKDDDEEMEENIRKNKVILSKEDIENGEFGKSRNTFVLNCTRTITWKKAREYNFRNPNDISSLSDIDQKKFKNEIRSIVKELFNRMDEKYNGQWPETSNYGSYSREEFETTFNNSYIFAVSTINDYRYTDEQREQSLESRRLSKDVRLCILDQVMCRHKKKIKRKLLLQEINNELANYGLKEISFGTLKRFKSILEHMDDDNKKELYDNISDVIKVREQELTEALESSDENSKKVQMCKKRLKQVNIKI